MFKYGKNNDGYWNGAKLHKQIVNKALPIAEALYPGYSLLFLFDNATSHSIYAKDALQVQEMNKDIRDKQAQLRNDCFEKGEVWIEQPTNYNEVSNQCILKKIQRILEEWNLWPSGRLNLEYPKLKCFNCQVIAEYKICVKEHKCELCKIPRQNDGTSTYTKNWKFDSYTYRK